MTPGAIDLGGQIDRVVDAVGSFAENLARIDLPYLAAALLLSLGLQFCRAHAWSNALRAACSSVSARRDPMWCRRHGVGVSSA